MQNQIVFAVAPNSCHHNNLSPIDFQQYFQNDLVWKIDEEDFEL